jgi:RimJ/RimL family protein N-acetyltransferase
VSLIEELRMKNKDLKIIDNYPIFYNNIDAGHIRLVSYYNSLLPHLEFEIKKEYRQKSLMTQHLPIYLQQLKEKNITSLIALVKKDNLVSIKLLEQNNFIELTEINECNCYIKTKFI